MINLFIGFSACHQTLIVLSVSELRRWIVKTLEYFYGMQPWVRKEDRADLLCATKGSFERSIYYSCAQDGDLLVLTSKDPKWTENHTNSGLGSHCKENSAWGIRGLDQFRLVRIVVKYDNALVPFVPHRSYQHEWLNGESYWGDENPRSILVTCLPSRKTVEIAGIINPEEDQYTQRIRLLSVIAQIEVKILMTKTLVRLVKSIRANGVNALNKGRIDRYVHTLFGLIDGM